MSKLFVTFIFAILAFNVHHIIEVVAPKIDEPSNKISDSTSTNGSSPDADVISTSESQPDSSGSSTYEPLIMIVKENQINTLFPIRSNKKGDIIPFGSIQILSEKQLTDQLSLNEKKIYFWCPQPKWENGAKVEGYEEYALFEKHFAKDEAHRCSIEHSAFHFTITGDEYQPTNCLFTKGLFFQYAAVVIGYPLMKKETKTIDYFHYTEGMEELIKNVDSDKIQANATAVAKLMIEMYQLCYDNNRHRVNWIIRKITPWAQVERNPKNQEELYSKEAKDELELISHKIVPSEENSFEIWKQVTSYKLNYVPVWRKLKPLIDLIDERLEKYSREKSKLIKVMTKLEYNDHEQRANLEYSKPETLLIQAYDEDEKSAITFVIHNTCNDPPQKHIYCKEPTECHFMKWFEKQSIFDRYINDSVTSFAYCCKTMKDEFPMLLNIDIENAMDVNLDSTTSPTT